MADEQLRITGWDPTGRSQRTSPPAPPPNATWKLAGGTAWVYYGVRNQGLVKPVILSDGFHGGGTKLDDLWHGIDGAAPPFYKLLRERGHDVILLGYDDCTVSMFDNANTAIECIMRSIAERLGDSPLTVGGFSMGGLITRFALAKLEMQRMDHQTATYFSYDSPHHGAWMPIALQALAHSLPPGNELAAMVNSDASRQLLWHHKPDLSTPAREDPKRTEFREALTRLGNWPMRPRLLGAANGKGQGDNGIGAGQLAVAGTSGIVKNAKLYTQNTGEAALVAEVGLGGIAKVRTNGLPAADGAHGGKLQGFGLAADKMGEYGQVTSNHRWHSFVPTGSAIATAGFDPFSDLGASVLDGESELHEFKCASQDEEHTLMTSELGNWLAERFSQ